MAPAPILIKCPCGVETRGETGDIVICTGCGARYDTAAEAKRLEGVAAQTQRQFRYLSRAGLGFIGLLGVVGLVWLNVWGLLILGTAGAVVWFVLFMPWMKRRMLAKASSLYTPTVAPTRK
jgi:hypothetical protein